MAKSCLLILTANLIKFAHFYLHEKQNLRTLSLHFLDEIISPQVEMQVNIFYVCIEVFCKEIYYLIIKVF